MRGEQKKIPRIKIRTLQIWTPLPIGAAQVYLSLVIQQISFTLHGDKNSPRFAYSSGHYLLILLYWGGNGKT
jgi:hypothetical protein